MDKTKWPQALIDHFVSIAQHGGSGREKPVGGGNTAVEITIMKADLGEYADWFHMYVGGTARIILNRVGKPIGSTFRLPKHRR